VKVSPTGSISNNFVGQPLLETYADGTSRLILPAVQFGTSVEGSAGEILIRDAAPPATRNKESRGFVFPSTVVSGGTWAPSSGGCGLTEKR